MSDIKTMVNGLNKFLSAIYGEETRLSLLFPPKTAGVALTTT